jgi:hypothetical protein
MTRFITTAKKSTAQLVAIAAILGALFNTATLNAQNLFCSNATMNGSYAVHGTGTILAATGQVPFTVIGQVTYFGDGTATVNFSTSNAGGTVSRLSPPAAGTYSVKADCTGSKILGGTHYDFVVTPDGRLITWVVTESGIVLSGTGVKLDRRN